MQSIQGNIMKWTKEQLQGFKDLAARENAGLILSEKPTQIDLKPPWEQNGISTEEHFKSTSTTLYRALLSIKNADATYIAENKEKVLQELSKVVEASGYFLMKKETVKINSIVDALRRQIERVQHESQSTIEEGTRSSSEN